MKLFYLLPILMLLAALMLFAACDPPNYMPACESNCTVTETKGVAPP